MAFEIHPTPTQYDYIMSEAYENCIVGPRGEGKSESGIMGMTVHSDRQDRAYRPVHWALIRDTWKNLERTTLQNFLYPQPGSFGAAIRSDIKVKDNGRELELPGRWKVWLFGIDTLGDLNKLQGMGLGGLWFEEPAPAAIEEIGGGIQEEAYILGVTSLRQTITTNHRIQVTMNYPDEDHWTWKRFYDHGNDERKLFRIARGENRFIKDQYRKNWESALSMRPDLLDRLVIGRPAKVYEGEAVTPEYDAVIHRSSMVLDPMAGQVGFRFWDGGLNPTCIFAQIIPIGQMRIIDTLRGENIGMEQLIKNHVIPLMANRYVDVQHWRDIGDPAIGYRDQSDSTMTAATKIEENLFSAPGVHAIFEPGISDWQDRREALKTLFFKRVGKHEPAILLSKHEGILHRALNGGWHYHKDTKGKILRDKPVKDIHSHPGDALSHAVPSLFPVVPLFVPKQTSTLGEYDAFA